jgi:hypothetical protein
MLNDPTGARRRAQDDERRDQKTPLPFTTFDQSSATPASKPWLLKGLLARGETSGWVGPPGSLKSAILTSVAYAIAAGRDWCGKRCKEKCAVLYVALERADLVRLRLHAYYVRDEEAGLPIAVVGRVIDLMDQKTVPIIVATIDAVEAEFGIDVGLVIIDTLPKAIAAGGGDEDRAKDQGRVFANLQRIKEQRNVHVALVCHPGKDVSRGPRGSNASTADFDAQIEISGTDIRTATVTKANDMAEGVVASFEPKSIGFGNDEDGDPVDVCIAEPVAGAPVRSAKAARPPRTPKAAAIALAALREAIDELGEVPPASNHLPPGIKTVTEAQLRLYAYKRGISGGEERAKQKAFRVAFDHLNGSEFMMWDDHIWLIRSYPRGEPGGEHRTSL